MFPNFYKLPFGAPSGIFPPQGQPMNPPYGGGRPPEGGGQFEGPPSGPPPSFAPSETQMQAKGPGVYAVDPGAIRPCTFRYVYIRLSNGRQFWAWLTFVGRTSASGWRWNRNRWVYFGIDLRRIDSFECY